MYSTEVRIPTGFSVGILIGRGGSNCKELQRQFGTRVTVDSARMVVLCTGGRYHETAEVIRAQIAAGGSVLGAYPHPQEVVYVLPFQSPYRFREYDGPAILQRGAGGRILQLHSLQPMGGSQVHSSDDREDEIDALTARLGAQRLNPSSGMMILIRPATESYCQSVTNATLKAADHRPAFDEIKMRYAIGKQTFYESRSVRSPSALLRTYPSTQDLGACVIGHDDDFKSMFSEYNEKPVADALERRVTKGMGFKLVEEKVHASVHMADHGRQGGVPAGLVISLKVHDKAGRIVCTVRKIKSSTAKPILVAFLNETSGPDFRLKVVAQYHVKATGDSDSQAAWRFAESCAWSSRKQEVDLPASDRFRPDTVRIKTKKVYAGSFQGHEIRFTTTVTADETGEHIQLGGCAPAVQEALRRPGGARGSWVEPLKATVAFCDALMSSATP